MVQGNWERRAEMSVTRRLEAKQRKQRQSERKVFKAQAHDLMQFLNRNVDHFIRKSPHRKEEEVTIHIWTDTPPRSEDGSPLHKRFWEEDFTRGKKHSKHDGGSERLGRRGRSTSFEGNEDATFTKSSKGTGHRKKKLHPRSKESPNKNNESGNEPSEKMPNQPSLCRSYFFFGKCCDKIQKSKGYGGNKNYGCRFAHYPNYYLTMENVLLSKSSRDADQDTSNAEKVVYSSENSCPASIVAGDNVPVAEAMDMVYYLSFRMDDFCVNFGDGQNSSTTFSHLIVDAMAKQSCNIGSIVYFAIGKQLLYDRYRKGIVIEESKLEQFGRPKNSANSSRGAIQSMPLSSSILENILLFLDDRAVASMSSVSRSWNREIGTQSGNLWQHLLQRRSWPIPHLNVSQNPHLNQERNVDRLNILREAFISHYTAVRDIEGLKRGIECLLSRKPMSGLYGSIRSFESAKSSSQSKSYCVAVKIWSPDSLLSAYRQDCSIRLFDSVEGSESSDERLCRELVCYCVDPYKKTKKKNCELVAIALDTDVIGCLLCMVDERSRDKNFILTVLSRENFLMGDELNNDSLQVIDIRQSVLNFLLSYDNVDHELLRLHDFLLNDGELDDIDVFVSQSLVECGYGRFMVEVAIVIPPVHADDESSVDAFTFRKLYLFSTNVGAITWMSDSGPSPSSFGQYTAEMTLASLKLDDELRGYEIVSLSCVSPTITSLSIDHHGNLYHSALIEGTNIVRDRILSDPWSLRRSRKRPVLMLEHELVVADNLVSNENGLKKSIITFYPMDSNNDQSSLRSLDLLGNLEVCSLIALRTAHVIAICRVFESTHEADDFDEVAGHWFGPGVSTEVSAYAIVIDVQSRSEIYRTCFVNNLGLQLGNDSTGLSPGNGELPIQIAVQENTVVAGLGSKGVILTGAKARRSKSTISIKQEEHTTQSKSAKKTKKKKVSKKSGKKDGFARGQKM